jgi:Tfp pilus assembly protein PilO
MGGAKRSTWIGGTAVIAILMLVASWFLMISPALAAASTTRADAEQVRTQNDLLSQRVLKLAADFKKLPEYKKQLDKLRIKLPQTAQLAKSISAIDKIAEAHSVTVADVVAAAPTMASDTAPAAPPAPATETPTDGSSPSPSPTESATPAPAPDPAPATGAVVPAPEGLVTMPVSLTVLGSYEDVLAFVSDLQNVLPRIYLVTGLTATGQTEGAASAGRPATRPGDVEMVVVGTFWVLPEKGEAPAPDPTATLKPVPDDVNGKNPMVPIKGK